MADHPIFAAIYDRALAACERDGLREMRAQLLAEARGETLEIGAGTGHNLHHYPDAVTRLVLAEPDPHMANGFGRTGRIGSSDPGAGSRAAATRIAIPPPRSRRPGSTCAMLAIRACRVRRC